LEALSRLDDESPKMAFGFKVGRYSERGPLGCNLH
jgi:hypothetical protein